MVKHVGLRDYSCFLRDLHGFGPQDVSILTIPSELLVISVHRIVVAHAEQPC